ncbi:MAG: hypothetical protein GX128_06185 [Bacteroidales bacterium]|jgi:transposase-like protein|nr:hypothetical protein [Bacteroidales bacterium]
MKGIRRTFRAEFKAKVAIEVIKEVKTTSELAHIYQIHPKSYRPPEERVSVECLKGF